MLGSAMAAGSAFTVGLWQPAGLSPVAADASASAARRLRGQVETSRRSVGTVEPSIASQQSPSSVSMFAVALAAGLAAARPSKLQRSRAGARKHRAVATIMSATTDASVVLEVRDVQACSADDEQKQILKGVNLTIREGEVHALMGTNGSGKSTLARVLTGDSGYEVTGGTATLGGKDLFDLEPHERSLAGLFMAFQSPPAVGGVSNLDFMRAIYNSQRKARGEPELDVIEFYGLVTAKLEELKISTEFLNRSVNEGFSGGERKRNEMLQMSVLEPSLAILDEIDSGLDIDALKDVADAIYRVRNADNKRSLLVVTHFERFLKYIDADHVHVMHKGRIIKSGGKELANRLDAEGYDWVFKEAAETEAAEKEAAEKEAAEASQTA